MRWREPTLSGVFLYIDLQAEKVEQEGGGGGGGGGIPRWGAAALVAYYRPCSAWHIA